MSDNFPVITGEHWREAIARSKTEINPVSDKIKNTLGGDCGHPNARSASGNPLGTTRNPAPHFPDENSDKINTTK